MDLNKVQLIGRITSDLELKKMGDSDVSVLNFSLATNRKYKNRDGNPVEEAEFHRCVAFGVQADLMEKYVSKGRKMYLEGRLRTRKWEDTNGNTRYTTEIVVENIIFLDGRGDEMPAGGSSTPAAAPAPAQDDEDLPF